jgi:Flp pilus assembly protein TadD
MSRWKDAAREWWPHAIVGLAAFLVFAELLAYPRVFDDKKIIPYVEGLYRDRGLAGVVLSEWRIALDAPDSGGFYRPVAFLSLWADSRMAQIIPWNHHATNLALHAADSLLLLTLLTSLLSPVCALWGALLFAVHPVHVESVALATNRTDLLACFFLLVSVLCWRRARAGAAGAQAWGWFGVSLAACCLGGLSKEVSLVLPAVLLAWSFLESREARVPPRAWLVRSLPWLLGWVAVILVILALRRAVGIGFGPDVGPTGTRAANDAGLSGFFGLWGTYFRLLVCPWPLKAWYGRQAIAAGWNSFFWLAVVAGLTAFPAARGRERNGVAGLIWTVTFLIPVSGVVPLVAATAAERFLYLPSVGFSVVAAVFLCSCAERFRRRKAWIFAAAVLVILGMGALSATRVSVWSSNRTFSEEVIRVAPADYLGYTNLGAVELEEGNFERALSLTREAVRLNPNAAGARINLGMAYEKLGRKGEAMDAYRGAFDRNPGNMAAVYRLAPLLEGAGRSDEAADAYRTAIRLNPADAVALNNFGVLLSGMGRLEEASENLTAAVKLSPGYDKGHYNLGLVAMKRGLFGEAVTHFGEAVRLNPAYSEAYNNLGIACAVLGRAEEAARAWDKTLALDPGNREARGNIERLRQNFPRLGREEEAAGK